jgi:hypothetical protein
MTMKDEIKLTETRKKRRPSIQRLELRIHLSCQRTMKFYCCREIELRVYFRGPSHSWNITAALPEFKIKIKKEGSFGAV